MAWETKTIENGNTLEGAQEALDYINTWSNPREGIKVQVDYDTSDNTILLAVHVGHNESWTRYHDDSIIRVISRYGWETAEQLLDDIDYSTDWNDRTKEG
jgi:hypothetical protein